MNKNWSLIIVLVALAGLVSSSCMEEPSPVGSRLLQNSDRLILDTTTVSSSTNASLRAIPQTQLPTRILIGKTLDRESWAAIRFTGIPDTLVLSTVLSAQLTLRANYHFGDSLAPFSFAVHRIVKNWGTDSLTIDTLRAPGFALTSPMSTLPSAPIGDTSYVSVDLDTSMVRTWLNVALDSTARNFGILLKPASVGVVKGFATSISGVIEHRPKLTIRYSRQGSTRVDTVTVTGSTEVFATFSDDATWLTDSTRLYVHNGLSSRGSIEFDISTLTKATIIHKALLELTLDVQASRLNSFTTDSLYAFFVTDEGVFPNLYALSEPKLKDGRKVYQFPITSFVQIWSRTTNPRKVILAGYTEHLTIDSFVFYGAGSPLGPKLILTYSPIQ